MNHALPTPITRRELARRDSGAFEITLYWEARGNTTSIEVHEKSTAETIAFPVASNRALDAFHHPFAHLAEQEAA
jgi:hypothetical protein